MPLLYKGRDACPRYVKCMTDVGKTAQARIADKDHCYTLTIYALHPARAATLRADVQQLNFTLT